MKVKQHLRRATTGRRLRGYGIVAGISVLGISMAGATATLATPHSTSSSYHTHSRPPTTTTTPPPAPYTVALSVSGQTISATANVDLWPTPYALDVVDQAGNQIAIGAVGSTDPSDGNPSTASGTLENGTNTYTAQVIAVGPAPAYTPTGAAVATSAPLTATGGATSTTLPATTTTLPAPDTTTTTVSAPVTGTTVPPTNEPSGIAPPSAPAGTSQVLFDNFTGTSLNTSTTWWTPYSGTPSGTDGKWLPSHVIVANGLLNVEMYQDAAGGDAADDNWVGGGLQSQYQFPVGSSIYVDMRVDGHADVSDIALLMGADNWPPEIDFVETSPSNSTVDGFTATAHYGSNNFQVQVSSPNVDMSNWNVWGVQWTASSINYTVNGTVWATIPNMDNSTSDPYSLVQKQVLSLQTQTGDPGTPGADSSVTASNPVDMQVDWVEGFAPA